MHLHSLIIDDFLDEPKKVRSQIIGAGFKDELAPDGVIYPGICAELPLGLIPEIFSKLELALGVRVTKELTFARQSPRGVRAPHQAHTDAVMGQFTFLVYLNDTYEDGVGTEIVKHVSGMERNPVNEREVEIWRRDTNLFTQWTRTGFCQAKFNRAFLVDSYLYHRALPVNGKGEGDESRLVLISFFNV